MFRIRSCFRAFAPALVVGVGIATFSSSQAAAPGQSMPTTTLSRPSRPMGGRESAGRQTIAASALAIAGAQRITVYVLPGSGGLGFTGPDGAHHDTIVPSGFVLRKGVPVTFTVINLDDMSHSITAPRLGVNIVIKPGTDQKDGSVAPVTTTYTFTPAKAGEFRWFCVFPCDMPSHWAMSAGHDGPDRDGFMAGIIRVF